MPEKGRATGDGFNPRVRAKQENVKMSVLRKRVKAGDPTITGQERGLVRMGPTNTRLLTGQENLDEWDDEELRRGYRRNKNGNFQAKTPVIVPKKLHDELVRRTLVHANDLMRDNLEDAVRELVAIATSEACEAKDRLRAISMIMDRVMGKPADKVEISGQSPWLVALQGGIVAMNGAAVVEEEEDPDDITDAEWEEGV